MTTLADFMGVGGAKPWISGTAYVVGDVRLSPADNYQSYVRVIAGAGTTDPSADSTNWKPFGGRAIKSVQRGTIAITSTGTSWTATVTAVNMAKAELRLLGGGYVAGVGTLSPMLVLTNSTTVTATTPGGATGNATTVSWELTEHY